LYFIGGGDPYLYAFDKATGREIARVATPFRTSGNPMTYVARNGRQYVVISSGGGPDATVTGFSLGGGGNGVRTQTAGAGAAGAAPPTAMSGEAAYDKVCSACHGARGQGGIAPGLAGTTRSAEEVLGIVRDGFGQMPPVSSRELTDEQIGLVYSYLRSLAAR
jgi:mono/diheme cytochrome c family protein